MSKIWTPPARKVWTPSRRLQRGFFGLPAGLGSMKAPGGAQTVMLLMHMNGANNSTTFTDNSATPKTVTPVGDAKISTTESKFGGASAFFDGTGDYLTIPGGSYFDFGTGDFCIEFFFRVPNVTGNKEFIAYGNPIISDGTDIALFGLLVANRLNFGFYSGTTPYSFYPGNTVAANTWYFTSYGRIGGTTRLFLDGTEIANASHTASINTPASRIFTIGRYTAAEPRAYSGYLDEFRVSKGDGVYPAGYTPPTSEFPNP